MDFIPAMMDFPTLFSWARSVFLHGGGPPEGDAALTFDLMKTVSRQEAPSLFIMVDGIILQILLNKNISKQVCSWLA